MNPELKEQARDPAAPFDFGLHFPGNRKPYNEIEPNHRHYSRFMRPDGRN